MASNAEHTAKFPHWLHGLMVHLLRMPGDERIWGTVSHSVINFFQNASNQFDSGIYFLRSSVPRQTKTYRAIDDGRAESHGGQHMGGATAAAGAS